MCRADSLCQTIETNTMLYNIFTSVKINTNKCTSEKSGMNGTESKAIIL